MSYQRPVSPPAAGALQNIDISLCIDIRLRYQAAIYKVHLIYHPEYKKKYSPPFSSSHYLIMIMSTNQCIHVTNLKPMHQTPMIPPPVLA